MNAKKTPSHPMRLLLGTLCAVAMLWAFNSKGDDAAKKAAAEVKATVGKAQLQATRLRGTAPLAVLFDATSTTASAGADAFRQLTYSFDFGDERGQTWAVSGQPKNTQSGGPLAAHVFDQPGTYTVTVRATDASGGTSDARVTVTVADPASVYAGTKTVCVSPSANYSGCPSGATQQTSYPTTWNGKRVLLHRGESFGAISILDGNSGVQVATYGSGNKPVVASVGIGNWRPSSANFANDITVMDLDVQNGIQQSLGSRVLVYRNDVKVTPGSSGIPLSMGEEDYWYRGDKDRTVPQSAFHNAREIFFVENNALGGDTKTAAAGFWGSGSHCALLGNVFGTYQQHSVRISALHKGVIAHNDIRGISGDGMRHALKLHGMGLKAYADGFIHDLSGTGGWATDQVVIANNIFGSTADNNAWTVAVSPQNDQYAEGIEDVIVENNRFVRGKNTSADLTIGGRRITSRGNTVAGGGRLIERNGHDSALPAEWKGPQLR
ncbi:MAG: PKD domain-containing protein [Rhizobacter sp.]|nr:PKD domain-containing protein [Rhizobacter sp.]